MNSVPAQYHGVWSRLSLRDADGSFDTATRVRWLQTGSLYCDLRVPADRPDMHGARCLEDLDDPQLRWLAAQQGFAGTLQVEHDICRWHRNIDYQPDCGRADVGRMRFADDVLVEDGVYANYREQWQRLDGSDGDLAALELVGESDGTGELCARGGCLVVSGDYFMFALGRTCMLPPAPSLADAIARERYPRGRILQLLDFEISFGRRRGGAVPWEIELSTLPFREGQPLLVPETAPMHRDGPRWCQAGADPQSAVARTWLAHHCPPDFRWFD
jgi:hypothetical protein